MLCGCVDSAISKKGKMEYRLERKKRMRVTKEKSVIKKRIE